MRALTFPGEALRKRRIERGFSLKDIQEEIRVPLQYIEALERGDLSALPAPTYTSGFLASYCEHIGLPPAPYLDRYRTMCDEAAAPKPERRDVTPQRQTVYTPPPRERQRPAWMGEAMTWGTICGIVLLGWITYSVILKPAPEAETRVNAGTFDAPAPPPYHFLEDEISIK